MKITYFMYNGHNDDDNDDGRKNFAIQTYKVLSVSLSEIT